MTSIDAIEGIGPAHAATPSDAGIRTGATSASAAGGLDPVATR